MTEPHIKLRYEGGRNFPWRWQLFDEDGHELAEDMTYWRWSAVWGARRAWRKIQKHRRKHGGQGVEFLPVQSWARGRWASSTSAPKKKPSSSNQ